MGTVAEITAQYEILKSTAAAGNNTQSLSMRNSNGRATLVAKFGRTGNLIAGYNADITVIEELYAIDVIKDIAEHAYYVSLNSEIINFIRYCVENRLSTDEITSEAARIGYAAGTYAWANWSDLMKSYRYHLTRGVESYFETGFVLRRSLYGVSGSFIQASFTGINTVVTAPTFSTQMSAVITALPAGEWLYRPPQAEHLGKRKWRVSLEWQWALKWSILYGGTWNGTT